MNDKLTTDLKIIGTNIQCENGILNGTLLMDTAKPAISGDFPSWLFSDKNAYKFLKNS